MNRSNMLAMVAVCGGIAAAFATSVQSQVGPPKSYVALQPTSPGFSQNGHLNVNGTVKAQSFSGSGSGLTGVPWSSVAGMPSTLVTLPYWHSGDLWDMISLESTASSGRGISVTMTSTSGPTSGLFGRVHSDSGNGVRGENVSPTGSNSGVTGIASSEAGRGVTGIASSGSGTTYGVYASSASTAGYGVYAESNNCGIFGKIVSGTGTGVLGNGYTGVRGDANVNAGTGVYGVGGFYGVRGQTATPSSHAVHGESSGIEGIGVYGKSKFGVKGESVIADGAAVVATASGPFGFGVKAAILADDGIAVSGITGSSTGSAIGIYGASSSPNGYAAYFSGRCQIEGSLAIGIEAGSDRLMVAGNGANAIFASNNGSGRAIQALANTDTAIWAITSSGQAGVDAWNSGSTGKGVMGQAIATSGVNYGVFGASFSPDGWGVWSSGRLGASGTKSFRIDHPLDPENKYLLHYSSESPEPQNFYNGVATTNDNGEAWVQLPNYFESINRDFRYQLTVLDEAEFALARVAKKIAGNRFLIKTNRPNVEVSWEVKAIRNDPWVQRYGAPSEVVKPDSEKGTYLHPELYGQPESRRTFRPTSSKSNSLTAKASKGGK